MRTCPPAKPQRGMVLLLCLIFLTALMLLGLSASADTILQTRLVANLVTAGQVNQSAQAALETAERWLLQQGSPATDACQPPCQRPVIHASGSLFEDVQYKPYSWWQVHGRTAGATPASLEGGSSSGNAGGNPPVWIIVSVHSATASDNQIQQNWYRVLARASDSSGGIVTVLESIVLKTRPENGAAPDGAKPPTSGSPASGGCRRVAWRRLR